MCRGQVTEAGQDPELLEDGRRDSGETRGSKQARPERGGHGAMAGMGQMAPSGPEKRQGLV